MKYASDPKTERDDGIQGVSPQTLTLLVEASSQLWTTRKQFLLYSNHALWFSNNPIHRRIHEAFHTYAQEPDTAVCVEQS